MPSRWSVRRARILVAVVPFATMGCFGSNSTVPATTDARDAAAGDGAPVGDSEVGASDGGSLRTNDAATSDAGDDAADGGACAGGGGPGTFTCTGDLTVPREAPGAAVLGNGKVLVAGGWNATSGTLTSAEIYDPATSTFSSTGPMSAGHLWSGWTAPWPVLPNGAVLAAGGLDTNGTLLASAELYDPTGGTFSSTGPLVIGVIGFGATSLADGSALFIGGYSAAMGEPQMPGWTYTAGTDQAQRYDPSKGTFAQAGTLAEQRLFGCNVSLASGDVLAVGGWVGPAPTFESNVERFDAATEKWSTVGTLPGSVTCSAGAFALPNGKILLDGSALLDPTTYATTPLGNALAPASPALVQLASGNVLAAGGTIGGTATARAQVYDVTTNMWTDVGNMHFARSGGHRALLVAGGNVLIVGGAGTGGTLASAELYHP
jgi:large repetitive protein